MARIKYFNETTGQWEYADAGGLSIPVADSRYIKQIEIGVADGIATLDANGKVPESQLPEIGIGGTYVESVNGKTGAVTLEAADIGAVTSEEFDELSEQIAEKVSKTGITLGLHSDGKYYIFVDSAPVGTGFELSNNSGDVFGYVDENNNIILNGALTDGSYSIKYEVEDKDGNVTTIDIGDLVLDSNVYYSVTYNLTNCTSDNNATQVIEGESYSATINASDGYELSTVTVKMGGNAVSVDGGVISIASVTGNIVITAVAEEKADEVEPTNFCVVDTSVTTAPNPSNLTVGYANTDPDSPSYGWISGGRCSSSGEDRTDSATTAVTNYIPVQNGDVVYVKNLDISTNVHSGIYKSDYSAIAGFYINESATHVKDVDLSGEWEQFTINNENAGFIRITGAPSIFKNTGGSGFWGKYDVTQLNIIVNIKRNGEWVGAINVNPEVPDEPSVTTYTNQIPISTDANGDPYNNGQGWKTGYRLNSSGAEVALSGIEVTGFIPFKLGDVLYVKNIVDDGSHTMAFYNADYAKIATITFATGLGGSCNGELMSKEINAYTATEIENAGNNIAFIRVSANEISADSIITVNEPIE